MKKKVFNKKLSLNKETIASLNQFQMYNVKGGNVKTTDESMCSRSSCDSGTGNTGVLSGCVNVCQALI